MLSSLHHGSAASQQQRSLLTGSRHDQILIHAKELGGGRAFIQTWDSVVILQWHACFKILLSTLPIFLGSLEELLFTEILCVTSKKTKI